MLFWIFARCIKFNSFVTHPAPYDFPPSSGVTCGLGEISSKRHPTCSADNIPLSSSPRCPRTTPELKYADGKVTSSTMALGQIGTGGRDWRKNTQTLRSFSISMAANARGQAMPSSLSVGLVESSVIVLTQRTAVDLPNVNTKGFRSPSSFSLASKTSDELGFSLNYLFQE